MHMDEKLGGRALAHTTGLLVLTYFLKNNFLKKYLHDFFITHSQTFNISEGDFH